MTDNERKSYRDGFIDGYKLGYEEGKKNFHDSPSSSAPRCLKCGRNTMDSTFYVCGIVDCPQKVDIVPQYTPVNNTCKTILLNEDNMNKGTGS